MHAYEAVPLMPLGVIWNSEAMLGYMAELLV